MQLRYLEYFVQAVECKSLNRAARKLDVSPQALCAGVAALEGSTAEGEKVAITARNDRAAVDAGLEKGFGLVRLGVGMLRDNDSSLAWTFALDGATEGCATLSGVKTPAASGGDDNPDAALLEKLYLLEPAAGVALELFERR